MLAASTIFQLSVAVQRNSRGGLAENGKDRRKQSPVSQSLSVGRVSGIGVSLLSRKTDRREV